jgi:hypothetical protein
LTRWPASSSCMRSRPTRASLVAGSSPAQLTAKPSFRSRWVGQAAWFGGLFQCRWVGRVACSSAGGSVKELALVHRCCLVGCCCKVGSLAPASPHRAAMRGGPGPLR